MLIETVKTTKIEEKQTIEVELPYYTKQNETVYAIINEREVMEASKWGVSLWKAGLLVQKYAGCEPATEAEFLAAYTIGRMNTEYSLLEPISLTNGNAPY